MKTKTNSISLIGVMLSICLFVLPFLIQPVEVHALENPFILQVNADTQKFEDKNEIPKINIDSNGALDFGGSKSFGKDVKSEDVWNEVLGRGRSFIVGISGIGALVAIGVFIVSFMKLGSSAGNPQARSQAVTGLLWSGLAAAGLGSVTLITALFYNAI